MKEPRQQDGQSARDQPQYESGERRRDAQFEHGEPGRLPMHAETDDQAGEPTDERAETRSYRSPPEGQRFSCYPLHIRRLRTGEAERAKVPLRASDHPGARQ